MKLAFSFSSLILLFSAPVLALAETTTCPQLTGVYDCVGSSGKSIHVELENINGTTYRLEDQLVIRASEMGVENIKLGPDFKISTTAICRDQALDVETEVSNPQAGKFLSFVQRSYVPTSTGDVDVLVTWNDSQRFESTLIRCHKKTLLEGF